MANHCWSEDDEIIALGAYFCAPDFAPGDENILKAAAQIGCSLESIHLKLINFRCLDKQESLQELTHVSAQSRNTWACFAHDRNLVKRRARDIIKRRQPPKKISRREARQGVMQIMYASLLQNIAAVEALAHLQQNQTSPRDKAVFTDGFLLDIVAVLDDKRDEIFRLTHDATGRAQEAISFVERAIIYTAVAEFLARPQTDCKIIISEAAQIAKQYGADGGYKIVNGALNKIAAQRGKTANA